MPYSLVAHIMRTSPILVWFVACLRMLSGCIYHKRLVVNLSYKISCLVSKLLADDPLLSGCTHHQKKHVHSHKDALSYASTIRLLSYYHVGEYHYPCIISLKKTNPICHFITTSTITSRCLILLHLWLALEIFLFHQHCYHTQSMAPTTDHSTRTLSWQDLCLPMHLGTARNGVIFNLCKHAQVGRQK